MGQMIVGMTALLFFSFNSFSAVVTDIRPDFYPIDIQHMRERLDESVALVFNDADEERYGDFMQDTQLDMLCEAIHKMKDNKPKVVLIDLSLWSDVESSICILKAAVTHQIQLVIGSDAYEGLFGMYVGQEVETRLQNENTAKDTEQYNELRRKYVIQEYNKLSKVVGEGHLATAFFKARTTYLKPREMDIAHEWQNPGTQMQEILPNRFGVPAYLITLLRGIDENLLRRHNPLWTYRVAVGDFSERGINKVSYSEAFDPQSNAMAKFKDKYLFVGVDQDKYDAASNTKGEIVNGVFIHLQLMTSYLYILESGFDFPEDKVLVFREPELAQGEE